MRITRFARSIPGHPTDNDTWPSWVPPGSRRRLDPLVRLASAAVDRLLSQGDQLPQDTAVIVATSYGAVESTFRFANSMHTYGDAGGSPTPFTTSVHNSCAAALGELLHVRGPTTTICNGALSPLLACRFAVQLIANERAPAALIVAGERHNDWSRNVVSTLSGSKWPISDGLIAALIEPNNGPGRLLRYGRHDADICIDGGALSVEDEQLLASTTLPRQSSPGKLNGWWPGCSLASITWEDQQSIQITEVEGGCQEFMWLGPHVAKHE